MQASSNQAAPSTLTFALDLGDGTRCTAKIDVAGIAELPADRLPSVVALEWTAPRKPSHFDRYRDWIADVWQIVANASKKSICSILITPQGRVLAFLCAPDQKTEFRYLPLP